MKTLGLALVVTVGVYCTGATILGLVMIIRYERKARRDGR